MTIFNVHLIQAKLDGELVHHELLIHKQIQQIVLSFHYAMVMGVKHEPI